MELLAAAAVTALALTTTIDVSRTLSAGGSASVEMTLGAGELVRGTLEQGETDFTLTVLDPQGRQLTLQDARERGTDIIAFITATEGVHRLVVRAPGLSRGAAAYRLQAQAGGDPTAGDRQLVDATALATNAHVAFENGDQASLRESVELSAQALTRWRQLDRPVMVMASLGTAGDALYQLSRYRDAQASYLEALDLSRRVSDTRGEAEFANNLGMTDWRLGEVTDAARLLQQALDLWRRVKNPQGEAVALTNRGILLRQSGQYDAARRDHARALALHEAAGNQRSQASALNNIAIVLDVLGQHEQALQALARAVALYHRVGDRLAEGRSLIAQARIELALRRLTRAAASTARGLPLIRGSGNQRAEAEAIEQRGHVRAARGDLSGARLDYQQALTAYQAVKSPRGESDALHDLGVVALASHDGAEAIRCLDGALRLRQNIGARGLAAETLFVRAQARRLLESLTTARDDAAAAVSLSEELRGGVFERELRTSFSAAMQKYSASYVDILVASHRATPDGGFAARAFEIADRAKARTLLERMRETAAARPASAESALMSRGRELRAQLDYWGSQRWERSDAPAAESAEITRHLDSVAADLDRVEAELQRSNPAVQELWRPQESSSATVQQLLLDGRTMLLSYTLGEAASYVWAVTNTGVTVMPLPGRSTIERHARQFYEGLGASAGASPKPGTSDTEAVALGRLLLGPVAKLLTRPRLIVVADGALHYVPFGLLRRPGDGDPLIAHHEVAMAPSATLLATVANRARSRSPAPRPLAAVGDPVFDANDPRVNSLPLAARPRTAVAAPRRARRLPFSRDEVDRILALAPAGSVRALDFDASRARVAGAALESFRIIHLATHAVRNDAQPEGSGILLSLVDRSGAGRNGFLSLRDIHDMRLHADLVVLSACDTGTGRLSASEGLTSLAHGFFQAGASRIVASLWSVDDEATATLMQLFYRRLLADRMPPAAALREAQLELRAQPRWQHPRYWSGWMLQGLF